MHLSELKVLQKLSKSGNNYTFKTGDTLKLLEEALDYIEENRIHETCDNNNNKMYEVMLLSTEIEAYVKVLSMTAVLFYAVVECEEEASENIENICNTLALSIMKMVDALMQNTTSYMAAMQSVLQKENNPLYELTIQKNRKLEEKSIGTQKQIEDAMDAIQRLTQYDMNKFLYYGRVIGHNLTGNIEDMLDGISRKYKTIH